MAAFSVLTFRSLRSAVLSLVHHRSFSVGYTTRLGGITMRKEHDIIPVHRSALQHLDRVAIKDSNGSHTYKEVLLKAIRLSKLIKNHIGKEGNQERIGFLCSNDVTYVISQWACWAAGHIGNSINSFWVLS